MQGFICHERYRALSFDVEFVSLEDIAGVSVRWTELANMFRYFSIAVNYCSYNLVGSLNFKIARTDQNLELIV